MTPVTDCRSPGPSAGPIGGLRYPVAWMVARAARDPIDRGGPDRRKQDGMA
jgi:hypothetical protein